MNIYPYIKALYTDKYSLLMFGKIPKILQSILILIGTAAELLPRQKYLTR